MIKCFLLTKVDFITALNVHLFLFYQEERNEGRKEIEKERERKPHMGICTLYIHLCNNSCVCMPTCMYVICTQMNILKSSSSIREGNGTPLQYACLENPMDGGTWKAAVHVIAEGRTGLSNFTFTFHFHALEKEMQPTPVFLPGESQGRGSLVDCLLWGCTESDTNEVT